MELGSEDLMKIKLSRMAFPLGTKLAYNYGLGSGGCYIGIWSLYSQFSLCIYRTQLAFYLSFKSMFWCGLVESHGEMYFIKHQG